LICRAPPILLGYLATGLESAEVIAMCKRAKFGTLLAAVALVLLLFPAPATADPPDFLRNYRLIPRYSTLKVTGGFAGVTSKYSLAGTFGLVTGYQQNPVVDSPLPVLVPYAEFVDVDVDAWLNDPRAFAAPLPLEQFVDLEKLFSFYESPPTLNFRGKDSQGAPFKLKAQLRGRLIRLTGANDAPCCDFFDYTIDAYAHLAPFADFNFDGAVDTADYTTWRNHLGMTSGATLEQGDADGDGDVDAADYAVWRQDRGTVVDMSAFTEEDGASGTIVTVVPEPSTFSQMVCGVLFFVGVSQWLIRRNG
jgi:hypothetical protein